MRSLSEITPFLFSLLTTNVLLVAGSTKSTSKGTNFAVTYLDDDIPDEEIKSLTLGTEQAITQVSCSLSCLSRKGCVMSLFKIHKERCVMLKKYLPLTDKYGRTQQKTQKTKTIALRAADPCYQNLCKKGRECVPTEYGFKCSCRHNEDGEYCQRYRKGRSCNDIKGKYEGVHLKNGEYAISINSTNRIMAYCDMEFDEGGWTQVANIEDKSGNGSFTFNDISSFAEFSTDQNYLATGQFLVKLKELDDFKQIRFQCKSETTERMIHIKTNILTPAVIKFLIGKSDDKPIACGSFIRCKGDNSQLSQKCAVWGHEKGGFWAGGDGNKRLADHPMYVKNENRWLLDKEGKRYDCDNQGKSTSIGNFWKVFIR